MARFSDLPDEMLVIICEHLEDSPTSLKALALASISPGSMRCAQGELQKQIDVTSGDASVVHDVLAQILATASSTTSMPPNITGEPHTDTFIRNGSSYRRLRLCLFDKKGVLSHVNNSQVLQQYLMLLSKLGPRGMCGANFWSKKLRNGNIDGLLHFLLMFARNIEILEMEGSLEWMAATSMQGMLQELRILRLKALNASTIPTNCRSLLRLSTLHMLELSEMTVSANTVSNIGDGKPKAWELSITDLRLIDCYVTPVALSKLVQGCRTLVRFQYTMREAYWPLKPTVKSFDLAHLLYDLRTNHQDSLKHLEVRALDFQVHNDCHSLDEVSQLRALHTISLDYDSFHFHHANGCAHWVDDSYCEYRRLDNRAYFTNFSSTPPSPVELMMTLPRSLQRLEVHQSNKTYMTWALLCLMQDMKSNNCLQNLVTIKVTFRGRLSRTIMESQWLNSLSGYLHGHSPSGILRHMAATVRRNPDVLYIELEDTPGLAPHPYPWQM